MIELYIFIGFCILLAIILNNRKRFFAPKGTNSFVPTDTILQRVTAPDVSKSVIIKNSSKYESNFNAWKEETIKILDDSISLSDLLINKKPNEIFYGDLLSCFEWKFKRLSILHRDSYECRDCKKINKFNHVHHIHYIKDELPWEIEDSALVTLCYDCHKNRHESTEYQVFKRFSNNLIPVSKEKPYCSRCRGTGYIPTYKHVQNGICFKCWGNLISQSVFYKIIRDTYINLNSYQDGYKRAKYKSFIDQLTVTEFINKVPDYQNYILQKIPTISSFVDYDTADDLPF